MHLVWKEASVQESSGPVAGRMQPAHYQFPTFRRSSVLPQTSRIKLCKTSPGSDFFLADCARFWPNGSGPEASQCARIIRPACGQFFLGAACLLANLNCAVQMPVWGEQDESVEGCCCSVGNVQARLTLAKTGYVPGEPITYTIDIFNKCDSTIERVELELKQVGGENIDNNRELIERFQTLKVLCNLKKNIQCTNTHNHTNK